MATTESPERIERSRILAKLLNEAAGPCSNARSFDASLETTRRVAAGSPERLPWMSPVQPSMTWWLVTTWPLALITKPVPVWLPVLPDLGLFGAPLGASDFAATALGAAKSPALLRPSALTLLTQVASTLSNGPVEVRLNCSGVPPATATIRLDFWNVRATLGGRI